MRSIHRPQPSGLQQLILRLILSIVSLQAERTSLKSSYPNLLFSNMNILQLRCTCILASKAISLLNNEAEPLHINKIPLLICATLLRSVNVHFLKFKQQSRRWSRSTQRPELRQQDCLSLSPSILCEVPARQRSANTEHTRNYVKTIACAASVGSKPTQWIAVLISVALPGNTLFKASRADEINNRHHH